MKSEETYQQIASKGNGAMYEGYFPSLYDSSNGQTRTFASFINEVSRFYQEHGIKPNDSLSPSMRNDVDIHRYDDIKTVKLSNSTTQMPCY